MLIYACVSAHGYGHGSRTAAVLTALHQRCPHWRLVLSTALPASFLATAFGPVPLAHRPCRWDVGMLQADALDSDPAATLEALEVLEQGLPEQIAAESAWLRAQRQTVLVLGDVPPAAVRLAESLGAPLLWLASFGWEAIYSPLGGAFTAWAERCEALYRRGDLLLQCPLAMPMPWGLPTLPLGLTAGVPRLDAAALADQLAVPTQRERCALVSFGGLGLHLEPALLALWPDWTFLGHDPVLAQAPNGRVLPATVRPLEVMRLCSRLITKPGYSSFCEAMAQGVGIHAVHRKGFAEAPLLEAALQRHARHRLLSQADLLSGRWRLDEPLLQPTGATLDPDGAVTAAEAIRSFAAQRFGAGNQ